MKTRNEVTIKQDDGTVMVRFLSDLENKTREELQPLTRQYIKSNGIGIDRSWLWTKGRDVHLSLLFADESVPFLGKEGWYINCHGNKLNGAQESFSSPPAPSNGEKKENGSDGLVEALASALKGRISGGLDEEAIKKQVDQRVDEYLKGQVNRFEVVRLDGSKIETGIAHKQLGDLLTMMSIRQHCALIGPAASGKTHAAKQAADALGLRFFAISVGEQTTQSQIMGYMDAKGEYVRTAFREAVENGGLILIDEADAGNPNVFTAINAATANGHCGFPDGKLIEVHPDFVVVLAMNTFGRGADRIYVGRNEMDGATTDRFAFLDWEYDDALMMSLSLDKTWCAYVQQVRDVIIDLKLRYLVTSRAAINGSRALQAGMALSKVKEMFVWKGMPQAERAKVEAKLQEKEGK